MKTSINKSQFFDEFARMGRKTQFSYAALGMLFDYLEAYEEDTGEEIELDVIAICCDFSEEYCDDIAANYNIDISECIDEVSTVEAVREYLNDRTTVVGTLENGNIIYSPF